MHMATAYSAKGQIQEFIITIQISPADNPNLPIPIKSDLLAIELAGYSKDIYDTLIAGFNLSVSGCKIDTTAKNHKSACENLLW